MAGLAGSTKIDSVTTRDITQLLAAYRRTRSLTERLAEPLSAEDQTVQSMPDASPTKWHRAHTTWFFETFVLERFVEPHHPFDPAFRELFNSYYEGVGPQFQRHRRGLLSRPGADEIGKYRRHVDGAVEVLLEAGTAELDSSSRTQLLRLVELGIHHEQQHQELLLMDIKHALAVDPRNPLYVADEPAPSTGPVPLSWQEFRGGQIDVGRNPNLSDETFWDGAEQPGMRPGFASAFGFDNESPRHPVLVTPFRLARRLVTNDEWVEFIDDGGYRRPELWLSDGWHTAQRESWTAPLYWSTDGDRWLIHTLGGTRAAQGNEPVSHVSHYEADAYARWRGARLPTEFEWEHAAQAASPPRRPFSIEGLQPRPAAPTGSGDGISQLFGECWQWTSSAYLPYPGFKPAAGAVGEYNGKFMSGQMVLRGSSALTPDGHDRLTYRNFFTPESRWMLSGVRLAEDLAL
jgi:ergothioneine biosynthesis protein EgtB